MQAAFSRHWRLILMVTALAVGLLAYHAAIGTPGGHSYRHNLPWFTAFDEAFWSGDLYPRHLPDLWFGLGGLDFYFYAPMPFWIASTVGQISCGGGCAPGTAFAIGGAWMIILSGVSFFVLARRFFGVNWAAFAAVLYCVLPYHYAMDWIIRQAVGEIAAAIFIPLLILAAIKLLEERKCGWMLSLSFAGLVLSHLPVALITAHFLAAVVLWKTWDLRDDLGATAKLVGTFALWGGLGAALSAIYWLPAFMLLEDVSSSLLFHVYSMPTRWLFLDGQAEPNPATALMIKAIMMAALILSALLWWKRDEVRDVVSKDGLLTWTLAPVFFAAVLMTPVSWLMWEKWIISSVQFPWRVMILVDVSLALGATALLVAAVKQFRDKGRLLEAWLPSLIVGAALLVSTSVLIPAAQDATMRSGQPFAMAGAPEYFPQPFMSAVRETHGVQRGYDSLFAVIEQIQASEAAAQAEAAYEVSVLSEASDRLMLQVSLSEPGPVTLVFPHWDYWQGRLVDSDEPLALYPGPRFGLMTFDLPAGEHRVELSLPPTVFERIGTWLSAISGMFFIGLVFFRFKPRFSLGKALATNP